MSRKNTKSYFSGTEKALWTISVAVIVTTFAIFDRESYLTLSASLIGVTSLIFSAKGNPVGQFLMIIFSVLYGIISYRFGYYGEMITYLGMSMPMAAISLVAWLRNPYNGSKAEVAVSSISKKESFFLAGLSIIVTIIFFFILKYFGTANLLPSTFSVLTSFIAVYLTFRRSPYFALAYAANDLVLIVLWVLAAVGEPGYISVIACFAVFFANDIYGFINWQRMKSRQQTKV